MKADWTMRGPSRSSRVVCGYLTSPYASIRYDALWCLLVVFSLFFDGGSLEAYDDEWNCKMARPGISDLHSLLITSEASSAGKTLCGGGWTYEKTNQQLNMDTRHYRRINYLARMNQLD